MEKLKIHLPSADFESGYHKVKYKQTSIEIDGPCRNRTFDFHVYTIREYESGRWNQQDTFFNLNPEQSQKLIEFLSGVKK